MLKIFSHTGPAAAPRPRQGGHHAGRKTHPRPCGPDRGRQPPLGPNSATCPPAWATRGGFDRLTVITRYAIKDCGVHTLSLYVFSTENFHRDSKEVNFLMDLLVNNYRAMTDEMIERGCRILFSGRRETCSRACWPRWIT